MCMCPHFMVLGLGCPRAIKHHMRSIRHNYSLISFFSNLKESEIQGSLCCSLSEESNIKIFLTVENKEYALRKKKLAQRSLLIKCRNKHLEWSSFNTHEAKFHK